jgi:dolichol-phosphate mannosyltransferase
MNPKPLKLLSVVIPARDEEGCIASTVEHLHVELRLQNVPHEIVVVDDGSSDRTWEMLQEAQRRVPILAPVKNPGPHGIGRASLYGFDHSKGDTVVVLTSEMKGSNQARVVRSGRESGRS